MLGSRDGEQVHQLHALAAAIGRARKYLRLSRARIRQRGIVVCAVQHIAGGLLPVVAEDRLHFRDGRPLDAKVCIAPMVRVLRMPCPFLRDAHTAGIADAAVDDENLAMRSVVQLVQVVPARTMVATNMHARCSISFRYAASILALPNQSSITQTLTPVRARSANASANALPMAPDQ